MTRMSEPMTHIENETPDPAGGAWQIRQARLRETLDSKLVAALAAEELEAHFDGMPPRYWAQVTADELAWSLKTVHQFLGRLTTDADAATAAIMEARHFPELGCTKVLVCTWDRPGLLVKLAGYMSALRLNVVRAEVYTRADNIALDIFWVTDSEGGDVIEPERLRQLEFLFEGGLCDPPRFVSTWACHSHKFLPRGERMAPAIHFNNEDSEDRTILSVAAAERLGLLHDMLEILTAHRLNIADAVIDTVEGVARDVFFVTDEQGKKLEAAETMLKIEAELAKALA